MISTITSRELSERLRLAVARLQRILRQQAMGGLTLTQLSCLATIGREGPLPLGELAAKENLSPPFITKIVTKLEQDGLVNRAAIAQDRRVSLVSVSPAGRQLLDQVRSRRTMYLNQKLTEFTPEEEATLAAALPLLERLAGDETP
ncbi:MAG TPA: MarR family transcriptional regulator [Acidimicrobiia bacterium]|nr:MarR family transcriptional regulator [Acidimicrobiia bacterium]